MIQQCAQCEWNLVSLKVVHWGYQSLKDRTVVSVGVQQTKEQQEGLSLSLPSHPVGTTGVLQRTWSLSVFSVSVFSSSSHGHVLMCRVLFQHHREPQAHYSHLPSMLLCFHFQVVGRAHRLTSSWWWRHTEVDRSNVPVTWSASEDKHIQTLSWLDTPSSRSHSLFLVFSCGSLTELFSSAWEVVACSDSCIYSVCPLSPQLCTPFIAAFWFKV